MGSYNKLLWFIVTPRTHTLDSRYKINFKAVREGTLSIIREDSDGLVSATVGYLPLASELIVFGRRTPVFTTDIAIASYF